MALSFNSKELTLAEVYEAINNTHKAQLKHLHQFGKGMQDKLRLIQEDILEKVKKVADYVDNKGAEGL